jgi:predicted transcriptional regulator
MTVGQLMSRSIRSCHPGDSLNAAAQIMWEEDCGCVPVVQESIGDTVAVICEARGGSRDVVTAQ